MAETEWDLIAQVIPSYPNAKDLLHKIPEAYVALWDIVIRLNLVSFPEYIHDGDKIVHYHGGEIIKNKVDYFKSIPFRKSHVDIKCKVTPRHPCTSNKTPNRDNTTIIIHTKPVQVVTPHSDDTTLHMRLSKHPSKYTSHWSAHRRYLERNIVYRFGTIRELQRAYIRLHQILKHYTRKDFKSNLAEDTLYLPLVPRLHHEITVRQITDKIRTTDSSVPQKFLYGSLVGGGIQEITGLLVQRLGNKGVCIITPAPDQYIALFKQYYGFTSYHILCDRETAKDIQCDTWDGDSPHGSTIYICTPATYDSSKIRTDPKETILFMEMGGGTAPNIDLQHDYSIQVFSAETLLKYEIARQYDISLSNCIQWTYADLQWAKQFHHADARRALEGVFGQYVQESKEYLEEEWNMTHSTIANEYKNAPTLYVIHPTEDAWEPDIFQLATSDTVSSTTKQYVFQDEAKVNYLLSTLHPVTDNIAWNGDHPRFEDTSASIFHRISSIGTRTQPEISGFRPNTQLWVVPKSNSSSDPPGITLYALALLLKLHPIFREKYDILILVRHDKKVPVPDFPARNGIYLECRQGSQGSIEECIQERQHKSYHHARAFSRGHGLIILSDMQDVGYFALPCTDVVMLMQEGDNVMHPMLRCATEAPSKEAGFIVDMKRDRILPTLYHHGLSGQWLSDPWEMMIRMMELYAVDEDLLQQHELPLRDAYRDTAEDAFRNIIDPFIHHCEQFVTDWDSGNVAHGLFVFNALTLIVILTLHTQNVSLPDILNKTDSMNQAIREVLIHVAKIRYPSISISNDSHLSEIFTPLLEQSKWAERIYQDITMKRDYFMGSSDWATLDMTGLISHSMDLLQKKRIVPESKEKPAKQHKPIKPTKPTSVTTPENEAPGVRTQDEASLHPEVAVFCKRQKGECVTTKEVEKGEEGGLTCAYDMDTEQCRPNCYYQDKKCHSAKEKEGDITPDDLEHCHYHQGECRELNDPLAVWGMYSKYLISAYQKIFSKESLTEKEGDAVKQLIQAYHQTDGPLTPEQFQDLLEHMKDDETFTKFIQSTRSSTQ